MGKNRKLDNKDNMDVKFNINERNELDGRHINNQQSEKDGEKMKNSNDGVNKGKGDERKITSRSVDYSRWYLDVIAAAQLADEAPVKGCIVFRPNGYAIWERVQQVLDAEFKKTGVDNAYFPLLIPLSFLEKEASHVEGFAKECAVVTHHRLEAGEKGLVPAGPLAEPLVIRPTSETIMYYMYSRWIQSYRDLPLLLNQWANVLRWEMKTKPFLRTTEFLWQEGHTAHATKEEADAETMQMLEVYRNFAEKYLAIPVIAGKKTKSEQFPGADYTTTIEAMMQDGKALQSGTSHMLGQNFAKAFDVTFLDQESNRQYVWQTSWGLSTRIIGAIIMAHSDDKGLVLPPMIAPVQVAIIPVWGSEDEKVLVFEKTSAIASELEASGIRVKKDLRDGRPGPKFFDWEKRGVPLRIEIGPREIASGSIIVARRDTGNKEAVSSDGLVGSIQSLLQLVQADLYNKALAFRDDNTHEVNSYDEFKSVLDGKNGFLKAHWCGNEECEAKIKEETTATSRCIPFDQSEEAGNCIYCGKPSKERIIFAKAY